MTEGVIAASGASTAVGSISFCSVDDMRPEVMAMLDDKPFEDTLTTTCNDSTTTLVLGSATGTTTTSGWVRGNVGEFQDSGEQFIVADDPSSTSVEVRRGYNNTTPASHSSGVAIRKGFTYSFDQVTKALNNEIAEAWPYYWATLAQSLTPSASTVLYELNGDFIDLIRVTQQTTSTITDICDLTRWAVIERELPVAVASTGMALRLWNVDNLTNSVIVTYRAKLSSSTVECGLMSDCVVLGAVQRLVRQKAIPAVAAFDTQSDDNTQTQGIRTAIGRDFYFDYLSARSRVQADLNTRHRPRWEYVRRS